MKQTIIRQGNFRKSNIGNETASELNLDKWFKRFSNKLGISFNDPCCPDPENLPVAIDANGNLMTFDPVTGTWTTINSVMRVDPAITALGVDDTDGYLLTKELSIITGGLVNTGVELPAAAVGLEFTVVNLTTTDKLIYATNGDTIDDLVTTVGTTIKPEQAITFYCYTTSKWQSDSEVQGTFQALYTDLINEFTSTVGVVVDGVLLKDGGVTVDDGVDVLTAPFYHVGAPVALAGPGAVTVTEYLTNVESTGVADAVTLADGTAIGQLKKITHYIDGGSFVLTPTNALGYTTITFTSVGETAILQWNGVRWHILELSNSATPGTLPVAA